jgi:hypothetical protein
MFSQWSLKGKTDLEGIEGQAGASHARLAIRTVRFLHV